MLDIQLGSHSAQLLFLIIPPPIQASKSVGYETLVTPLPQVSVYATANQYPTSKCCPHTCFASHTFQCLPPTTCLFIRLTPMGPPFPTRKNQRKENYPPHLFSAFSHTHYINPTHHPYHLLSALRRCVICSNQHFLLSHSASLTELALFPLCAHISKTSKYALVRLALVRTNPSRLCSPSRLWPFVCKRCLRLCAS